MKCSRCGGFAIAEVIVSEGGGRLYQTRCIYCGEVDWPGREREGVRRREPRRDVRVKRNRSNGGGTGEKREKNNQGDMSGRRLAEAGSA